MAWYDNQKYIVNGPEGTDVGLNVMTLLRDISKMDLDSIVKEAVEYTKREGEPVGSKIVSPIVRLSDVWRKTDLKRGKHKEDGQGIRGTFRLKYGHSNSARAGPQYGLTQSFTENTPAHEAINVAFHEAVHIIQLGQYQSPVINGKRRPHSLLYNRIYLKLVQKVVGLKEEQCNPYKMGYNIANGYAPTRKLYPIIKAKIEARESKVMSLFKDKAVVKIPRKTDPMKGHLRRMAIMAQKCDAGHGGDDWHEYDFPQFAHLCWRSEGARMFRSIIQHKSASHLTSDEHEFAGVIWDYLIDGDYWGKWESNPISDKTSDGMAETEAFFFRSQRPLVFSPPKQEAIFATHGLVLEPALDPWDSLNVRGLVRLLRSHGVAVTGGKREDLIERAKSMGITPRGGA